MSILDDAVSTLQSAVNSASGVAQDWTPDWDAARQNLISKAQEFTQLWNSLTQLAPAASSDPQLQSDYNTLMARGDYIRSTVQSITQGFDSGADWFNNTLATFRNAVGLGEVPRAGVRALMRLNGLGILPLVPIAVILAAVAAITYWITDAYTMQGRLNLAAKVQAAGGNPASILNAGSVFGSMQGISRNLVILGGMALIGLVAWPKLKKYVKR